jgi:hypothetical protein
MLSFRLKALEEAPRAVIVAFEHNVGLFKSEHCSETCKASSASTSVRAPVHTVLLSAQPLICVCALQSATAHCIAWEGAAFGRIRQARFGAMRVFV